MILTIVIDICFQAFPADLPNETRPLCGMLQEQFLGPLLRITIIITRKSALRVSVVLQEDDKYNHSEKILL